MKGRKWGREWDIVGKEMEEGRVYRVEGDGRMEKEEDSGKEGAERRK